LGAARALRPATRAAGFHLLAVVALALLALAPLHVQHLAVRAENPLLAQQSVWNVGSSRVRWLASVRFFYAHPTAIPLTGFALILFGALCAAVLPRRVGPNPLRSAWTHGVFWALVGLLISMPLYQLLRVPWRLRIASLFGFCILTGVAFAEIAGRLSRAGRWRAAALAGRLGLASLVAVGMYLQYARGVDVARIRWLPPPRSYPLARAVAADSRLLPILRAGHGPLLELPVDVVPPVPPRSETAHVTLQAQAMYRSIFHWRPLINGYDSYYPTGFRERMALARRLPDALAVAALRHETGITTILVHTNRFDLLERSLWRALAEQKSRTDLVPIAADGPDLLFAVKDAALFPRSTTDLSR
jgi:hypothetical protein